jgi:hypothetical protein
MKLVAVSRKKEITVLSANGRRKRENHLLGTGLYRIRAIGLNASFHVELIGEVKKQTQMKIRR